MYIKSAVINFFDACQDGTANLVVRNLIITNNVFSLYIIWVNFKDVLGAKFQFSIRYKDTVKQLFVKPDFLQASTKFIRETIGWLH